MSQLHVIQSDVRSTMKSNAALWLSDVIKFNTFPFQNLNLVSCDFSNFTELLINSVCCMKYYFIFGREMKLLCSFKPNMSWIVIMQKYTRNIIIIHNTSFIFKWTVAVVLNLTLSIFFPWSCSGVMVSVCADRRWSRHQWTTILSCALPHLNFFALPC